MLSYWLFRLKLALPRLTKNIQGYRITYFRTKTTDFSVAVVCLATSYSHRGSPQLPSALKSLTSVFGMGTGVTSLPSSLDYCRPPIHGVLLRQLLSLNRSRTERSLIHSFASLYYLCLEALLGFQYTSYLEALI